jgi:hypothetical protein
MGSWLNRGTGFKPRALYMERSVRPMRRDPAKRLGTARPRKGSRRELEKQLESLNARYVKLRDGQECVQCKADGQPTRGLLDAGHLYPKGTQGFKAGKYLVENLFAQCRYHNQIHISQPAYFVDWFIETHGFEALEALHARCTSDWRPEREWLLEQIEERERQIEELELLAVA